MKMTMDQQKSQQTAEPLMNVPTVGNRLDTRLMVMIEECINLRFSKLKKAQMQGKQ